MNEQNASWEANIRQTAASFPYPPTPPIAAGVRQRLARPTPQWHRRRLAYAAVLLLLLAVMLAVPPVRAALVSFFRAGAITIFVEEPTPTPMQATAASGAGPISPPTAKPIPPPLETAVFDLAGRTTLAEAQERVHFPLRLPAAYGRPDEVYLQRMPDLGLGGQVVIMVWRDPERPGEVRLRLFQIDLDRYALKLASADAVAQTEVNGQVAYWVEGGHQIQLQDDRGGEVYFAALSVLVWAEQGVSYRLDGHPSMEAAVHIAETLAPMEGSESPEPTPSPTPFPDGAAGVPNTCPVTQPPKPPFIPPDPWPAQFPEIDRFWFGHDGLWTALPLGGSWRQLALGEKFWWWSQDFDVYEDSTPDLAVTARRLDGDAAAFQSGSEATNGYHESFNWAMLDWVELPSSGCWEFRGEYKGHQLSFVLWVPAE